MVCEECGREVAGEEEMMLHLQFEHERDVALRRVEDEGRRGEKEREKTNAEKGMWTGAVNEGTIVEDTSFYVAERVIEELSCVNDVKLGRLEGKRLFFGRERYLFGRAVFIFLLNLFFSVVFFTPDGEAAGTVIVKLFFLQQVCLVCPLLLAFKA